MTLATHTQHHILGALLREIQGGLVRIGFVFDKDGRYVHAILAIVEFDADGNIGIHTPVAEFRIPLASTVAAIA